MGIGVLAVQIELHVRDVGRYVAAGGAQLYDRCAPLRASQCVNNAGKREEGEHMVGSIQMVQEGSGKRGDRIYRNGNGNWKRPLQ